MSCYSYNENGMQIINPQYQINLTWWYDILEILEIMEIFTEVFIIYVMISNNIFKFLNWKPLIYYDFTESLESTINTSRQFSDVI